MEVFYSTGEVFSFLGELFPHLSVPVSQTCTVSIVSTIYSKRIRQHKSNIDDTDNSKVKTRELIDTG